MTRAKAVTRAQALFRLSKDRAATVAEADLAREHLAKLRARFDLLPHEVDPGVEPPRPLVPPPSGGTFIIINGVPVHIRGGYVYVTFNGATTTMNGNNNFFFR